MPNPGRAIRSADLYRKDGLSGSKMFKCWPVIYNDQAVRTPDLSLPRRIQRVRSFERKYKKLRERPKTIHGWDDFKLEDKKKEGADDECLKPTEPPVVVSIDTSGSNFERMQSLRLSGRRYQKKEEMEKKKRRRRTVTGVPENILHEIEKFDRQKRHEDGPRHTPRSYSFDDLDMEDDIERDEAMVKYLDEIDGKIEERMAEEKAQKLMKFFPCRRSRSLPRCIKLGSVTRSLSVERNKNNRDVDRDLNTSYGSSSLSLTSAVSSASSRLSRATKRSSALGSKLKSLMSGNTKDKPRQRPKSLDIDTVLDTNTGTNQIKSQERSKSTYSLERNREARSVPDSLLRQEFSEGSSSTVGPGTYYNFESSTLPRAQQKKYDFPWESLPKDWTTSVKLREISKRRAKEDRQSSSGLSPCENAEMTGQSVVVHLMRTNGDRHTEDIVDEDEASLSAIVRPGNIVAVLADDDMEDYYLMKVTHEECILQEDTNDDWGNNFVRGTRVIMGLYFDRTKKSHQGSYRLIKNRRAIVHSVAIIYLLTNQHNAEYFQISENEHLDVIHTAMALLL